MGLLQERLESLRGLMDLTMGKTGKTFQQLGVFILEEKVDVAEIFPKTLVDG